MTTSDQVILVIACAAMLFATAHVLRDEPRAPLLAAAVILLALLPIVKRYFFLP